jgi:NADH-quinone oxidoreductase subunit J
MTLKMYVTCGLLLEICAICVITSNNVIFSLVFLILSFLFASVILILIEADFIGLLLIVIYVGAIAILFLFAVMISETKMSISKTYNKTFSAPVGAMFGVILLGVIFHAISSMALDIHSGNTNVLINVVEFLGEIDAHNYGSVLYSYFAIQVLIVGMILLVIIIGVLKLTEGSNKKKIQSTFKQLTRTTKIC